MLTRPEDSLSVHLRRLRWLGFSLVTAICVNLSCVVYAVTRKIEADVLIAETPKDTPDTEVESISLMTPEQSEALQQRLKSGGLPTSPTQSNLHATANAGQMDELGDMAEFDRVRPHASGLGHLVASQRPAGIVRNTSRQVLRGLETLIEWQMEAGDSSVETLADRSSSDEEKAAAEGVVGENTGKLPTHIEGVTIRNPSENNGTVSFLANGQRQTLAPGQEEWFDVESLRLVFHRGGSFGTAEHDLWAGRYRFRVRNNGWNLVESD